MTKNRSGQDFSSVDLSTLSIKTRRCIESIERGYYVTEDGEVFGPRKKLKPDLLNNQGYPVYSTSWGGKVLQVAVHRLAAFCFYGTSVLDDGVVVRHLDGNKLNFKKSNIALGTVSDNEQDKNPEERKRVAKLARASQGFTPTNAKLTDEQVLEIREFYKNLGGKKAPMGSVKKMCEKYGVSRTVIVKIKNFQYYPNVLDIREDALVAYLDGVSAQQFYLEDIEEVE